MIQLNSFAGTILPFGDVSINGIKKCKDIRKRLLDKNVHIAFRMYQPFMAAPKF